eukprot:6102547-Prymnesium_polylepis.3
MAHRPRCPQPPEYETSQLGLETVRSQVTGHKSQVTHEILAQNMLATASERPCAEALSRGPGWRSTPWHAVSSADVWRQASALGPPSRPTDLLSAAALAARHSETPLRWRTVAATLSPQ